jgi:hypothetical protein
MRRAIRPAQVGKEATIMSKLYTITAGDNGTDLGRVGTAKTILGAKRIGRAAVLYSLPRGEGVYKVRDTAGREVLIGERSLRTGGDWYERT